MNTPYLNPLDIFGLASTPLEGITPSVLLKHKRGYLSEVELLRFQDRFPLRAFVHPHYKVDYVYAFDLAATSEAVGRVGFWVDFH
jgi:hypothetical protein